MERPDSTPGWLSLSYQVWGFILLALVIAIVLWVVWRKPNDLAVTLWGSFVVSYAFFVLLTRIHERYLFAAVPLAAAATVFSRWMILPYVTTSTLYLANLLYVYSLWQFWQPTAEEQPPSVVALPGPGEIDARWAPSPDAGANAFVDHLHRMNV